MKYLWQHGIDIVQDAMIEAAIADIKKRTGAIVEKHAMVKIMIMQYGEKITGIKQSDE